MRHLSPMAVSAALLFHGCGTNKEEFGPQKRCPTNTLELTDLSTSNAGVTVSGSSSRGLLLTTVENYASSRLFFYDFANGKKSQLLSGESGDPGLFSSGDELFFFNRTADNSNLRTLTANTGSFKLGVQTAIPGAGAGDPQAVLHLDERFLLMSFWGATKLGIFDLQECTMVKTVEADFDVGPGEGNVFRPSSLVSTSVGANDVYIVHQGINSDGITLNGSQQVFILTWNGVDLIPTDVDAGKAKVQGIPLHVSNPTGAFLSPDQNTLTIVGSCTIFNESGCISGFETINLAARNSTLDYDMSALPEKNNGAVVAIDDHNFYAQLIIPDATSDLSKSEKIAARIDTTAKTITKVHAYPAESNGCCGLFYDQSSKKLLITDYTLSEGGSIMVMDEAGVVVNKAAVENTPYTGIIIP